MFEHFMVERVGTLLIMHGPVCITAEFVYPTFLLHCVCTRVMYVCMYVYCVD